MIRDRNKTLAEEIAKAKQESIAARDAEWLAVIEAIRGEIEPASQLKSIEVISNRLGKCQALDQLKARMVGDK